MADGRRVRRAASDGMRYAYAKLSPYDLGLVRILGAGLGNLLFPWARSIVSARRRGLQPIWPTWCQLRLGPLLRREPDKKTYTGLFRPTAEYVRSLGKLRRLLALPRLTEAALDDEKEGHGARPAVVVFEGMADYFASVRGDHALVRESLLRISRPEHTAGLATDFRRSMCLHVRLGDFAAGGGMVPPDGGPLNLRTPLSWYRGRVSEIRLAVGAEWPVHVFSDGTDAELGELLALPGVRRARFGSSLADLWALTHSNVLVASGSTFSMWASYLGRMPVIWPPGQLRQRLYDERGTIEVECERGGTIPREALDRLARLARPEA